MSHKKYYEVEAIGTMYFNGFERHKGKLIVSIFNVSKSEIEKSLKNYFPDFFEGILDYQITEITQERLEIENKTKLTTTTEVVKKFRDLEHNFI